MNHEIFAFFVVIGGMLTGVGAVIFAKRVAEDGLCGLDGLDYSIITPLVLAWLWLPWLIYGLTLLPWSQIRKILPPVEQTTVTFNPNGNAPQVEK